MRKAEKKKEELEFEAEWGDSPAAYCVEEEDCHSWVKAYAEQEAELRTELVECGSRAEKQAVNRNLRHMQYFLRRVHGGFVRATTEGL